MALITITLSDETFQKYGKLYPGNVAKGLGEQLERFKDYPPQERLLFLKPEHRRELESLNRQPIEGPDELVKLVKFLLGIRVGGVEVPLSVPQMKRAESRARFWKKETRDFLVDQVKKGLVYALGA